MTGPATSAPPVAAIPPTAPVDGADDELDLAFAGLVRQAELLAAREVSSAELVALSLRRIEALQPVLGAFRVVLAGAAGEAAAEADRRLAAGERAPLLGVPLAIKDDTDLAGETTLFGCGGHVEVAAQDAELVRRLRRSGAVIVGKTTTPEIGQWPFTEGPGFGVTRNPWHLDHTPGGSSGASAAAVAAGLVPAAVGSDGAGSIRIPAAWTGLVGIKPQRGRVSGWPHPDPFNGLTCFGPLARSTQDAAALLDALTGNHPGDRFQPPAPAEPFADAARRAPGRLRVALSFTTPFGVSGEVDPEIRAAVEATASRLAALGHEVFPADPEYRLVGPGLVVRAGRGVHDWCARLPDAELEPRTQVAARIGGVLGADPLLDLARRAEPGLARRVGRIFARADVVLTPTTAQPPPRVGASEGANWWDTSNAASDACPFAFAWNYLGWPGVSVPAGRSSSGLPIGAQLLGRANDEATLISLAAQLEGAV